MNKFLYALIVLNFLILPPTEAKTTKKNKSMSAIKKIIDQSTVKAPIANEVCFAPDDACDIKLIKLIMSAKKSVDIAIFDINLDQLVHEVLVQSKKISVRVLVDQRQAKGDHSLVSTLLKGGVNVRFGRQRGIMHNKFVIVDGVMLETGSFNFTNGAAFKNNENQIYLNTPAILDRYQKRFEKIWNDGKKANLASKK